MPKNVHSCCTQENLTVRNNEKERPVPKVHRETRDKRGGIGDAVSQTVDAKNTNGMQCSTAISGGQTVRPLLGLRVTLSERFWIVSF
jgi:hypothetical protein